MFNEVLLKSGRKEIHRSGIVLTSRFQLMQQLQVKINNYNRYMPMTVQRVTSLTK